MKLNKCLRRKAEVTTELKAIDTRLMKLSDRLASACKGAADPQLTQDLLNARLNLRVGLGAIKDIKAGRKVKSDDGPYTVYNYSHVLSPGLRAQKFTLVVVVMAIISENSIRAAARHPRAPWSPKLRTNEVGTAGAVIHQGSVFIDTSWVMDEYRGRGLGIAMYEALLAYAYHKGIRVVRGGFHSTGAMRVHQRLAAKHGLQYVASPNYGPDTNTWETEKDWRDAPTGENDEKYKPYSYPLEGSDSALQQLQQLQQLREEARRHGVILDVFENAREIHLDRIIVSKSMRHMGLGSGFMHKIVVYADAVQKRIVLSPTPEFGASSRARLIDFYKRFGFVENKGRNKNFEISASMYRLPRHK